MSVIEDKVFEDQIERMKYKNQIILERFKASEEDRKQAESTGSTINKAQNVQIRLRNDDQKRTQKKVVTSLQRPKSFHDRSYNNETDAMPNSQYNDIRKQDRFTKTNRIIDDEVAYKDYFHFQQTHSSRFDQNFTTRQNQYQNNNSSYAENDKGNMPSNRHYQRSSSQKNKSCQPFDPNNFQNIKITKSADQSISKSGNHTIAVKDAPQPRVNNFIHKNKTKTKPNKINNQNVDPISDKKKSTIKPKKAVLDDEYIDDTLEDLERYRLKVDMDDFIVIDPESPDPILAMPLTPWTKDIIFSGLDSYQLDIGEKAKMSSTKVLNNANERAKDYLNLVNQTNTDYLSSIDLNKDNKDSMSN